MDVPAYLHRIQYSLPVEPSKTVLFELQKHHLLHIPFENLDIHFGRYIELNINTIFEKIVHQNRGGFCYELNGLFYTLLKEIGFEVKMVSARVHMGDEVYGKEYDHMAIIATIEGQDYITDVGFGSFSTFPLALQKEEKLRDDDGIFWIDRHNVDYLKVNKMTDTGLIPQYIFKMEGRRLTDFLEMCQYHQSSQESHFTQKRVVSVKTEKGRVTLTNKVLKITENEVVKEISFEGEVEFADLLWKYFGIRM